MPEAPSDLPQALATVGLAGPTASGKTALALAAAERWPLEIISVDSALVYRDMNIGTAKPSPTELAQVPHHLIDVLAPQQVYSAAQFVADARRLVGEIHARGRHALLVGGTMLYFKALIDGIDALPAADAAVRAELDAQAAVSGWPALHGELALVDPVTAARLAPNDAQRIQRALEVWRLTGQPLSSLHHRARSTTQTMGDGQHADDAVSPTTGLRLPLVSLEPIDRAWLHRHIAQRFDTMLAGGLLREVQALRRQAGLHADLPSMRCVGYRQAWAALEAAGDEPSQVDLDGLRALGLAATRQLAKRQLTWLRGMSRQVVACDAPDALARGLAALAPLFAPTVAPIAAPNASPNTATRADRP